MLGENRLGLATSLTTAAIVNTLNFAATRSGVSDTLTVPVIVVGFGNSLSLWMDVMFAKRSFDGTILSYCDLSARNRWFFDNVFGSTGAKYAATALADGVIVFYIYRSLTRWCDRRKVMLKSKSLRNTGLAAIVTSLTFLMFGNFLRFNWAYLHNPTPYATAYAMVVFAVATFLAMRAVYDLSST
jgi:hypothetical protein